MDDSIKRRAIELCRKIEDTFDQWRDLGECFDTLGREWIALHVDEYVAQSGKGTQGLRKRMIHYLADVVEGTGFNGRKINLSLQYFALERNAPWVSQLRSESKARWLAGLTRWNWQSCRSTETGKAALDLAHKAIRAIGYEAVTVRQIRQIILGIRGRKSHLKHSANLAKRAVEVLWNAIDGEADQEELARWLDVLLQSSPKAADLLGAAFVRLEKGRVTKRVA